MFKVCRHQLLMSLASPKLYIALFLGCAIQVVNAMPLLELAQAYGRPLCILEGFIYFSCDVYAVSAAFLGTVFMVSDIPFSSQGEAYVLLRTSRGQWLAGKVLYLLSVCALYYFVILAAGMLFLAGDAYTADMWSEPVSAIAQGMDAGSTAAYFPYRHLLSLTPLQAVSISLGLDILYGFVMSLFLFWASLKLPGALGYAAAMLLHVVSYMVLMVFQSLRHMGYSLLGNALLMYHSIQGSHEGELPSLWMSLMVFCSTLTVMIILIYKEIRRHDFMSASGERQ